MLDLQGTDYVRPRSRMVFRLLVIMLQKNTHIQKINDMNSL